MEKLKVVFFIKRKGQIMKIVFNQSIKFYTALQYIDKDNFECPELGVVQKCSMILGEYQPPGSKFF